MSRKWPRRSVFTDHGSLFSGTTVPNIPPVKREWQVLNLSLGFLDQKKEYLVMIYADDAQFVTPTHIKIYKQSVTSASKL